MAFGTLGVFTVPRRVVIITAGVCWDFDLERVDRSVVLVGVLGSTDTLQREGEIRDSKLLAQFKIVVRRYLDFGLGDFGDRVAGQGVLAEISGFR